MTALTERAASLHRGRLTAEELADEAITRHQTDGAALNAYRTFDEEGLRIQARAVDVRLAEARRRGEQPPPLAGIPVSVKDLYGVTGFDTFAGTARRLGPGWEEDGWLVSRLRDQGALFTGKTHTVELAYGGVGINPHWGTPWNPWDRAVHRIPGGSSAGAGVSLWEGSALAALGSDTGGSIRIPASMTGCVGHRQTRGRWPVTGVVPLSSTLDTVGGLTLTVEDSIYFFGSLDPAWGDPAALRAHAEEGAAAPLRVGVPRSRIWDDAQADIADVLRQALSRMEGEASWTVVPTEGRLLDEAGVLYMTGGIAGAECRNFVETQLPGWMDILHPTVGERLARAPRLDSPAYQSAVARREALLAAAQDLFSGVDVLALPTAVLTPPPVADLTDMDTYMAVNAATLAPTCPVSMLGLSAVTVPVGMDEAGMPVGLQLVAPGGEDELVLAAALAVERGAGTDPAHA
ncbi:MAG: amidase [Gemmatimonadota bacterium]